MPTYDKPSPDLCSSGQVGRMSTVSLVEDLINRNIREQAELLSLKQWLCYNPPPKDVEEYLWSVISQHRAR